MPDLAILYEHPQWLSPLFAALDARGTSYVAWPADGHALDPAERMPPAPLVFNRIAMSSFLRQPDHPIFYAQAAMAHWAACGARVINGTEALARLGGVHRPADLAAAAEGLRFPIVVKANIGGSGAGIVRYDSLEMLRDMAAEGMVPDSIDKVWLVQEYVPVRDGRITRIETMGGRFLYAIDVDGGGGFDLCPADACLAEPGKPAITITRADPPPALIDTAERIVRAADIDLGGIEYMIDDRDGTPRFYDINGFSNFTANPWQVLGWDPHERLVDWLEARIAEVRA